MKDYHVLNALESESLYVLNGVYLFDPVEGHGIDRTTPGHSAGKTLRVVLALQSGAMYGAYSRWCTAGYRTEQLDQRE